MSDEHYPEFTSAQTERLDEIDNAVYQTILAFLNKSEDEFPWDMYYIGEVAECMASFPDETLAYAATRFSFGAVSGKCTVSMFLPIFSPPLYQFGVTIYIHI